jgi:hypothetical protein
MALEGTTMHLASQCFEGTFVDGKHKGKGKLQCTDGSLDIGIYNNCIRTGLGIWWSLDHTIAEAVTLNYDIEKEAQVLDEYSLYRVSQL